MMPDGLLPNVGLADQLEYLLKSTIAGVLPWELMFWVNDYTPVVTTVLADLVEATWAGYVRLTLDRAEWTTPSVSAGCAFSTWGTEAQTWYVTGGPIETIYGVAYVDPSTDRLRFVQRFDSGDITPVTIGGRVLILPKYSLGTGSCS